MRSSVTTKNELLQLTQEALKLASAACHFDRAQNVVGACDYYDKCLLNLDEVLNKLEPNSEEWKQLLKVRSKYDDRMEHLREQESSKYNLSTLALGGKTEKNQPKKRPQFVSDTNFSEIDNRNISFEETPEIIDSLPYWQLRNIKRTIDTGGFLTQQIFIPKKVWTQSNVKFSGLTAKTTAFDIVIKMITNNVETLYLSHDEDSLELAEHSFLTMEEELLSLRNHLSKPFPYIKEVKSQQSMKDEMSNNSTHVNNANNSNSNCNNNNINTSGSESPAPGTGSTQKSAKSLAQMVTSIGKNMRKYAEVGYQRLVVALPSKLSSDDLAEYTTLITKLCDKCQVLDSWVKYLVNLKQQELAKQQQHRLQQTPTHSQSHHPHSLSLINDHEQRRITKIENISHSVHTITTFVREIICEILLRDLENLLERYLVKTRKSFSRMYWDDDIMNNFEG